MTVYVDASVLLRIVLGEPGALRGWREIRRPISSALIRLECLRTIDKARIRLGLADVEIAERRAAILEQLDAFDIIALDATILDRAAEPFPTVLGTLDAVHLASAVLARGEVGELSFATHDRELAIAARAMGFQVLGASTGA